MTAKRNCASSFLLVSEELRQSFALENALPTNFLKQWCRPNSALAFLTTLVATLYLVTQDMRP